MNRISKEAIKQYKLYDIDALKGKLQDNLNQEISSLNINQESHINETQKKCYKYERLQEEHKEFLKESNYCHENRKTHLSHIQVENIKLNTFSHQAAQEKRQL